MQHNNTSRQSTESKRWTIYTRQSFTITLTRENNDHICETLECMPTFDIHASSQCTIHATGQCEKNKCKIDTNVLVPTTLTLTQSRPNI